MGSVRIGGGKRNEMQPLDWAIQNRQVGVTKVLLAVGADAATIATFSKWTVRFQATKGNKTRVSRLGAALGAAWMRRSADACSTASRMASIVPGSLAKFRGIQFPCVLTTTNVKLWTMCCGLVLYCSSAVGGP